MNARYFLGSLEGELQYEEVTWEEFRQAWHEATLRVGPKIVCGPHAKGFYFHDGGTVAGTCNVDGSALEPVRPEGETLASP